jgi:hypothetical protein
MPRDEQDREDLLREATALVERIELVPAAGEPNAEPIVIGFRRNGGLSIFFGADPVYQFNPAGELRRAYRDGLLYKAERGRLVSLARTRTPREVQLVRKEPTEHENHEFVARMQGRLRELAADLAGGGYRVIGQVPAESDVLARAQRWLAEHDGLPIAASPRA